MLKKSALFARVWNERVEEWKSGEEQNQSFKVPNRNSQGAGAKVPRCQTKRSESAAVSKYQV